MRCTLWARIEVSQPTQEGFDPHRLFVRRCVGEVGHKSVEQRPARLPELLLAGRPAFLRAGQRRRRRAAPCARSSRGRSTRPSSTTGDGTRRVTSLAGPPSTSEEVRLPATMQVGKFGVVTTGQFARVLIKR